MDPSEIPPNHKISDGFHLSRSWTSTFKLQCTTGRERLFEKERTISFLDISVSADKAALIVFSKEMLDSGKFPDKGLKKNLYVSIQ